MGNSSSQPHQQQPVSSSGGTETTNGTGENVISFDLFGGATDEQVVVTRDFSLDLVDFVNYDDKYLDQKYPDWKEQAKHFDALLGAFTKCSLDSESYYGKLGIPSDFSETFSEVCTMNEYVKFRTGKNHWCLDGIIPTSVRPLTEQEAKEIHRDIKYCYGAGYFEEDLYKFESRRMRWAEPETLIQVRPKIMSVLKSRKFKPGSNDPTNIMSNYYLLDSDDEKTAEQKLAHIRDQVGKQEYEEILKCSSSATDLERECIVERQVFGLLVGTALCKNDILKCLEKNSSLHGNKLEEVPSFDFANCVSTSACFNSSVLNKVI